MIDVFSINRKGKLKLKGHIDDDKQFTGKSGKLRAYIQGNAVHFWNRELVYYLDDDNQIVDEKRGVLGYMKELELYSPKNQLDFLYDKNNGEVKDYNGISIFLFKGDIESMDNITFLGFCFAFLDLFC